jgi:Universal stress protein family
MVDFFELDRAAAEDAGNIAQDGVRIAQDAGLKAEPVTVEATGPVWKTIVEIAGQHDAATIVMGSRGLTGMRSMLLGAASPAPSCITPTGPRWSSIALATTLTSTDRSTPEEWSRRRSPSQWWHPPPAHHHPAVAFAFVADPGLVKRRLDGGVDPELLDAVGRHADDEHLGHGSQD